MGEYLENTFLLYNNQNILIKRSHVLAANHKKLSCTTTISIYTWKDNGFYEGGYNVVGKETYYIDFVTDNQFNGTSIESAWWIALNTDYKSCDCGIPSVMYFYNSELEYIIQTTADLIDLQPNYCVPMTCTWKIVNLLNNAPINVSALTLLLRNNTSDYIEAISNKNDVLFRLNYTNNAQILQFNITASEFNITFSTGNPLTSEEGIPPAWALDIKPVVQVCECFGPFELSLTQFQQNLRIWPTYQEYYCYNMNCTWKITNEWTYDNAIVDLQIWEIYLRNNSKDYLQAYLPNGEVLFKLTYLDDCFGDCYSPFYDYKINAKEFYINFATGEPPEYPPPLNLTHGYFSVIANTEFQNCDCSVPSVYFFNYEEDFFQIGFDYQSYYCPSMDCTWKFINGYYGIYTIDVWNVIYHGIINSIALRNSSGDYIEARADDGRLIFRIDGSMSFGNLSYLIDDKIFNITFHSSNMSQTGVLPFWTLYMNPTNYVVAPSSYVTAAPTSNASSTSTPFLESTTKTATSITAMMKTIILSIMLQFIFLKDGF
uniref:CUB domain-containing protein n=1 Tax=Acrobeloides nanus TaxID=290746 RepID=A0A914DGK4_9BILA